MKVNHSLFLAPCSIFILASCSFTKQISKQAGIILLNDTAISKGHIGISIYEPATNTYWYNYNATKYFVPASNTKLFTLYAGMKYLGDSLTSAYYVDSNKIIKLIGAADPTFLHPYFKYQPLYEFIKKNKGKEITLFEIFSQNNNHNSIDAFGKGWAWDDFNSSYMAERNFFPIYGNVATFSLNENKVIVSPSYFSDKVFQSDKSLISFKIERQKESNFFFVSSLGNNTNSVEIPVKVGIDRNSLSIESSLLSDTVKQSIGFGKIALPTYLNLKRIHSQPSDSLFKPMMHRSDNFFAEQTLLMASNEHLGYMSDENIIDTLLKSDLKDVPQKPKWVDGSGLSRYNLFTPQSFVYILNKMKNEFGWERIKNILPTGGTGTLSSYYKKDSGFIYAKTGTLSNNCALSGYLITQKGKVLIFSVLVNNYQTSATPVRKAVEKFLQSIREKY